MKTFLAIYLGSADAPNQKEWANLPDAEQKQRVDAGLKAWHAWVEKHRAAIVVDGGPLGKTKRAAKGGITDTKNNMTAYTVVQAENHDAAARMFENHPHFTIFPGDSIEIMECLPIPGSPDAK
jgi:hypothetical protein